MKIKSIVIRSLLLLAVLVVPTSSALAQSPGDGDVVLFGQNYTLESGDTLQGSLALIGGNAEISTDSSVEGDVALIGGNLTIDGNVVGDVAMVGGNLTITGMVSGDIVIVGGQATLEETAVVNGNISTIGGSVEKNPGAKVGGTITNNAAPSIKIPHVPGVPNLPNVPEVPGVPNPPHINVNVNPFWNVAGKVGQAIVIALLGMLLTLFLQPQLERSGDAVVQQPLVAAGYGLLAVIVLPIAVVIMTITIILIPIALIVILVLPLAWLFGMISLGQEVGDRFAKAINQTWAPVISTGVGTFMLLLVVGMLDLIPCVGWMPSFILTLVALGGVALTWFGTRNPPVQTVQAPKIETSPAS